MGIRMNEARLEELKKILNERYQNTGQSLQVNSSAQDSNASKSDTSNLNTDNNPKFQNLHSTSTDFKNSKVQVRNYDNDPIIIKSYERFFITSLYFISYFSAGITAVLIHSILFDKYVDIAQSFWIFAIFFIWMLAWITISYIYFIKRHNYEVYFRNNSIDFYADGVLKRSSKNLNLDTIITKPIWWYDGNLGAIFIVKAIIILLIFFTSFFGVLCFVLAYFYMFLLKVVSYMLITKSLKNFKLFNTILVDDPFRPKKYIGDTKILMNRYYLIYYFDEKSYMELKSYFLNKRNIEIDNIKKYYLFF